jgi:hypothetical protein
MASVLAAGALVVSAPGSALAAQGVLSVSGNSYTNPAPGCYQGKYWPLSVGNDTDSVVFVFDDDQCNGRIVGTVDPHQSRVFEFGSSVRVP